MLTDCLIADNVGGGLYVDSSDVTLENSVVSGNSVTGILSIWSRCTLLDSVVSGNGFWGMYADRQTYIIGSRFTRNSYNGLFSDGWTVVSDSVFAGNIGGFGAAINQRSGTLLVSNSTFVGNSASGSCGGIASYGSGSIKNSILWENSNVGGPGSEGGQLCWGVAAPTLTNNTIQGWTGSWGGVGNSGVDPLFVYADGPDGVFGTEDDDLKLSPDSPAINGGSANYIPFAGETDLDGHARILCDRIDIGAYEFGIGDYDCDRIVDLTDFAAWEECMTGPIPGTYPPGCESLDFDANGTIDLLDFAAFQRVFSGQ